MNPGQTRKSAILFLTSRPTCFQKLAHDVRDYDCIMLGVLDLG